MFIATTTNLLCPHRVVTLSVVMAQAAGPSMATSLPVREASSFNSIVFL
jgi:hypothetical protein